MDVNDFELLPGDGVEERTLGGASVHYYPVCSEKHCVRPVYAEGLCKRHRDIAWYRNGPRRVEAKR